MNAHRKRFLLLLAGLSAILLPSAADAHPHVFVDAKVEVVFDQQGRMAAVRNIWQFDEAFSQYAVQGLDSDEDGKLSDEELQPLAKVNVESLKEFDFFTFLSVGVTDAAFVPPQEYWLESHDGRLTLFFTLPLSEPMAVGAKTTLEIFDPEYFVAFDFVKQDPISLRDAPLGCSAVHHRPQELDAATAAILSQIPADQRDLPPDLEAAALSMANYVSVTCK
jgi:ABC-type uncharacterized transport system substrate-binding protein